MKTNPLSVTTLPSAPQWSATNIGPLQCTVQWAADPGATSYVVAELFNVTFANGKPVNGSWGVLGTVGANVLSLNVTGLQPATSYLLDVYAGDAAGGSWGAPATITTTQVQPPQWGSHRRRLYAVHCTVDCCSGCDQL